jgi:ElaB/YqjD/DUF883 family membrane-anchored ribosome-binding protein
MKAPTIQTGPQPTSLTRDFQTVVTDAQELLRTIGNEGDAKLNEAKSRLQTSFNVARQRLGDLQTSVADSAKAAAQSTDDYVSGNPWQSVGIGAALGLIVGFLIARR